MGMHLGNRVRAGAVWAVVVVAEMAGGGGGWLRAAGMLQQQQQQVQDQQQQPPPDNGAGGGGGGPIGPGVPREPIHLPVVPVRIPKGTPQPADRPPLTERPVSVPVHNLSVPDRDKPPLDYHPRPMRPGHTGGGGVPERQHLWEEKSWIAWWETNRDAVLAEVAKRDAGKSPKGVVAAAATEVPAQRKVAVEALVKALRAERPAVRAAAAAALGQAGEKPALDRLVGLATSDPEWYVRGMAWVGVGLLGDERAEAAILAGRPQTQFEQLGVIAGLGMLRQPTPAAFQRLGDLAKMVRTPEVARMAVWALRVHHRAEDRDLVLAEIRQAVRWPVIESEAILALGAIGNPMDAEPLADLASDPQAVGVMALDPTQAGRRRQQFVERIMRFPIQAAPGMSAPYLSGDGTLPASMPQVVPGQRLNNDERVRQSIYQPIRSGRSSVLQVSAAIALGMMRDGKAVGAGDILIENALVQNFYPYLDGGGPMYAGASLMAFAAIAGEKDTFVLRDVLEMGTDPAVAQVAADSPLRGYAALGIGTYLARGGKAVIQPRPQVRQAGVAAVPEEDLNDVLARRFANVRESEELRAACVLALGLSGDPDNVRRVMAGMEKIDRTNELLMGYTILSLGLLKEKTVLNAAGPYLARGATGIDVGVTAARGLGTLDPAVGEGDVGVPQNWPAWRVILGQRAALLGVAVLGDRGASPILAGAWARDRATLQDVGRAMNWCKAYGPAEALAEVVARDQKGAAEAAVTLGWVFDPDRPSRLSRLVIGNNYHQPQADYVEPPANSATVAVRNYHRVGDYFIYSTAIGGSPVAAPAGGKGKSAAPASRAP